MMKNQKVTKSVIHKRGGDGSSMGSGCDNDIAHSNVVIKVSILVRGYVGVGKTSFCHAFAQLPENDTTSDMTNNNYKISRPMNHSQAYQRPSTAVTYNVYTKTVQLNNISPYLHPVIKNILSGKFGLVGEDINSRTPASLKTLFNDSTLVQITLYDTSGFDYNVTSLPQSMLRTIDGVIYLVQSDPSDIYGINTSFKWCNEAHRHLSDVRFNKKDTMINHLFNHNNNSKLKKSSCSNLATMLVFTKADLLLQHKDYACYYDQLLQNYRAIKREVVRTRTNRSASTSSSVNPNDDDLLYTSSERQLNSQPPCHETTMLQFLDTMSNRLRQCDHITQEYNKLISNFEFTNMDHMFIFNDYESYTCPKAQCSLNQLQWTSSHTGLNINKTIYQMAAVIIDSLAHSIIESAQEQSNRNVTGEDTGAGVGLMHSHNHQIYTMSTTKHSGTVDLTPTIHNNPSPTHDIHETSPFVISHIDKATREEDNCC